VTAPPEPGALAEVLGGPMGAAVRAGEAVVEPLPVPGLPEGTVSLVHVPSNPHMPQIAVGRGPGAGLRVLTGRPAAFSDLVADVPVAIPDPATAIGFVRGFLAATRDADVLLQVPERADQIAWRPGSPEEEERRAAFLSSTDLTARAEAAGDGFDVALVVLRDQHARRSTFHVGGDGIVAVDDDVLVDGLPLPILR